MNKGFFSECIQNRPLFSAMLEFNIRKFQPEENMLPECRAFADPAFFKQKYFAKYAAKLTSNKADFFWDFTEESKRLALLDGQTLAELCFVLGTCIHSQEIAHTLEKEKVLALKNFLGKELYAYAVCRAPFQARFLKRFFAEKNTDLPLADKIKKNGTTALYGCTLNWQVQLKQDFLQKLKESAPQLTEYAENETQLTAEQTRILWFSVKKLLVQEVDAAWRTYFN